MIHRDIKGANILTNKDGKIKLADFGVATAGGVSDLAVVGSPYWSKLCFFKFRFTFLVQTTRWVKQAPKGDVFLDRLFRGMFRY